MCGKEKKELSLILVLLFAVLSLTGCSQKIHVSLQENTSGSYEETITMDEDLWDTVIAGIADEEMLLAFYRAYYPTATITAATKDLDGTVSKVFHFKMDFKDIAQFQQILSGEKPKSIRSNANYFSISDTYIPFDEKQEEEESPSGLAEEFEQLLSSVQSE